MSHCQPANRIEECFVNVVVEAYMQSYLLKDKLSKCMDINS